MESILLRYTVIICVVANAVRCAYNTMTSISIDIQPQVRHTLIYSTYYLFKRSIHTSALIISSRSTSIDSAHSKALISIRYVARPNTLPMLLEAALSSRYKCSLFTNYVYM